MGHTNTTVNYNLPQFVGTDKPSWLGDVNGAFLAIDTAIAAAKSTADSAAGGVAGLQTTVGGHTTQIGTLTETVTAQGGTLNAVTALIGNGTPTTTDQTIIGAINELAAIVEAGSVSVTADGTKTRKQLLESLNALVDYSKVSEKTKLVIEGGVYYPTTIQSGVIVFIRTRAGATNTLLDEYTITDTASAYQIVIGAGTYTRTDESATVVTSGHIFKLIY